MSIETHDTRAETIANTVGMGLPSSYRLVGIKVVECDANVAAEASGSLAHRCPFVEEVDLGYVTLGWYTAFGKTLELHSLRAYLDQFRDMEISHEDLVQRIQTDLNELEISRAHVKATFCTAGMDVVVRSG